MPRTRALPSRAKLGRPVGLAWAIGLLDPYLDPYGPAWGEQEHGGVRRNGPVVNTITAPELPCDGA